MLKVSLFEFSQGGATTHFGIWLRRCEIARESPNLEYYDVLNDLTLEYLARYQRLTVISGVAHDSDLDGIMDKDVRCAYRRHEVEGVL